LGLGAHLAGGLGHHFFDQRAGTVFIAD
jgi:hypothetical protein